MGGRHHEKVVIMHKLWTCTGSGPRVCSPQPGRRQALPFRCFSPLNLTPAISEIFQTHARPSCSHTLEFSLPLRTATPYFFFPVLGPQVTGTATTLFFPNSKPGKMIEPACVAKGLVSTGSEGKNGAVSFPPTPPPTHFLPLAKRPGSI